ncbi:MAG: hypothetical protein HQK53_11590 [Oligoflexia bacterium]|nr:hypothetical protein [Oligoflexia bacterium]
MLATVLILEESYTFYLPFHIGITEHSLKFIEELATEPDFNTVQISILTFQAKYFLFIDISPLITEIKYHSYLNGIDPI